MLGVCADRHRKWAFHRGATRTSRRGTIFSDWRRDLAWPLPLGSQRPCIYWSVNWFVSFVLIFDPLRQVITSTRVSSRIRRSRLVTSRRPRARQPRSEAARRTSSVATTNPSTPLYARRSPRCLPRSLRCLPRSPRCLPRSLPRAGHSPLPLALRAAAGPLGNRNRSGNASIRDQSGLDAPVTAPRFR